jgi:RNA polymerase sigma-70 factor (ECF subfamily)
MSDPTSQERFVSLLTRHQPPLMLFIRSLGPNLSDADEVLQEVNLYLWRHPETLRSEEGFAAWAFRTAKYQVMTYRKRQSRARARFSDVTLERLSEQAEQLAGNTERRQAALTKCLDKLSSKDRELILLRYEPGVTTQLAAERTGRSAKAIYESLNRIRTLLLECIRQALGAEGGSS